MPPRSIIKSRDRPLSAIYIGSTPSTPASSSNANSGAQTIPDLPEPPSPVGSVGSGLPSPPATNSTGSGSTGDPASIARRHTEATQNSQVQNGSEGSSSTRSSSRLSVTHDEHDLDQDEEQTMRLKIGAGSNESVLQRARSLAQRNKLQLDKLASGKLGRASPSSSSSSRNHRHSMPDPSQVLSGSETEREGDSIIYNSTSSSGSKSNRLSSAPTSPHRTRSQHANGSSSSGTTSPTRRRKRVSYNDDNNSASDDNYDEKRERAPTVNLNSLKKTPLSGTRRRSALPREFREGSIDESTTKDEPPQTPYRQATESPLPATTTTSSTSSPMLNTGRRSTLRGSDDYRSSIRDFPSRSHTTPSPVPNSAIPASAKSTTDYDNSSPTIHVSRSNTIGRHTAARRERGQTLRGGSAESALGGPGGRSLVGEGLRAAGLSRRTGAGTLRDRERAISTTVSELDNNKTRPMRTSGTPDVFSREEWGPEELSARRQQHRRSALDSSELTSSSRTLPPRASTSMADYSYTSWSRRSRTSMSTLHQHSDSEDDRGGDGEDGDADADGHDGEKDGGRARAYKSAYGVLTSREASLSRREQTLLEKERELSKREREMERAGSVLGRYHTTPSTTATPSPSPAPSRDRYSGSFGTGSRRTPGHHHQPSQASNHSHNSSTQSEHAKLMVDSLAMFESQLVKLTPVLGTAGTNHAEMLTRNAQTLVVNAERLNTMLRAGNSRALDAQIEAEVEGDYGPPHPSPFGSSTSGSRDPSLSSTSLVDIWRKIGADYREGLRVSDDLVRAVTGLLLGVGRVMKEYVHLQQPSEIGSVYGGTPRGSPVVHGRSISLGEEDVRLRSVSPEVREPRRSWEVGAATGASTASGGGGGGGGGGGSSNASVSTGTGSGGGGSSSGVAAGSREEALRRLAGVRSDSPLARASPAFHAVRELDRLETASPALGASSATGGGGVLGLPKVNIPGARRLFAPSQQREMALVNNHHNYRHHQQSSSGDYYDPSPTPASRTSRTSFDRILGGGERGDLGVPVISTQQQYQHSPLQQVHEITSLERSRTLTLPPRGEQPKYQTPLRRNLTLSGGLNSDGDGDKATPSTSARERHEQRKISIASATSVTTIRGGGSTGSGGSSSASLSNPVYNHHPGFSTLSTPSGATTAVTLDNSSTSNFTSPRLMGLPMSVARAGSTGTGASSQGGASLASASASAFAPTYSTSTKPTFSRPEGILGLQQQLEGYRKRAAAANAAAEVEGSVSGDGSTNESASGKGKGRISLMTPESERIREREREKERERETRRKTVGVASGSSASASSRTGVRVSLDSSGGASSGDSGEVGEFGEMETKDVGNGTISPGATGNGDGRCVVDLSVNVADRGAAATVGAMASKERRRTVTDIWPRS